MQGPVRPAVHLTRSRAASAARAARSSHFGRPGLALTPLARAILAAGLLASPLLLQAAGPLPQAAGSLPALAAGALPTGLQVRAGQAAVQTTGAQMVVRNSPGAILNWKSFDIGAAASVRFDQANAASKVLNRVIGDDPSRILGRLSSNGQVWLLNPHGVLFGQGAQVDVAGLVASTLRLGDSDFLAQRLRFTSGEGLAAGVRNEGTLQTSFGGQVLLLGGRVDNSGDILAPGGQVALTAARAVDLVDTGLPNLAVRVSVPAGEVLNLGRLAAPGGRVDVYGAIVNQQGLVSAASLGQGAEGQLVLRASETLTLGAGSRTEASGLDVGQRGGDVALQGRQVLLAAGASVDASGDAGGGRIRLGGGLQGRDADMANAATVQVASGATLAADALGRGQGGQVIVWSDQHTRFEGLLRARGGALGGDGGFAEVSSKGVLGFNGLADLRAAAGAAGSLLLDPSFLTIAATGANISGQGGDLDSGSLLFAEYPRINSVITAGAVNTQLALGNVLLQADNDITVNAPVDGGNALTLQAGRNIVLNSTLRAASGITLSANDPGGADTGIGAVQMAATAALDAGSGALNISNNGGNGTHRLAGALSAGTLAIQGSVQLAAASTWTLSGDSTVSSAISGSQSLTKAGTGTLTLAGLNSYSGGTTVAQGTLATAAASVLPDQGTLTVAAGASLVLGGHDTIGALAGAGNVVLGSAELESDTATSSSFSGQISGAGSFVKQGSGWLTLSGSNTYTGMTTVRTDSGRLIVAGSGAALPGALTIDGGRVVLDNTSLLTLPSLTMMGGWLSGSGEVAVSGPFSVSVSSAEINGAGSFTTRGSSSINLGNVSNGFLGVSKPWTNTGSLTLGGDDFLYFGYSQGNGGSLTNAAGGTVTLATSAADAVRIYTGGANVFNNAGTLRQTATGAHAITLNSFHNTGTVEVQAGTLALAANGSDTGSYRIDAGAMLDLNSGTRNFDNGIALAGEGTLRVTGGTLNVNSASGVTLTRLTLNGGTLGGPGNVTVSGAFDVTGTYANLSGSGTLTTQGNSTVDLANVNGGYLGIGRNWVNEGTLSFGGNDFAYLGYPNGGTVTLTNAAGATLNLNTSATTPLAYYTGTSTIVNQGTLNHNATGRHTVSAPFSNGGTVNVNAGTLELSGSGTDGGAYNVAADATLEFGGGTRLLAASTNIAGAGSLRVSGGTTTIQGAMDLANTGAAIGVSSGTLNFGGSASGNFAPVTVSGGTLNFDNSAAVTLPSLTLSGGTVGGSGNVTVSGAFDVTGTYANLSGSGTLTTQGNSTVDMANVNGGYLGIGRNWVNEGTLSFGGNDFAYLGYPNGGTVTLTNAAGATLNLNTSATTPLAYYTGTSTIVNQGTLNHNATGRHTVSAPFSNGGTVNVNTGTLEFSGSGTDGGAYNVAADATLEFGGGTRLLAASTNIAGAGSLRVSGGTTTIQGAMDLANTGAAIGVSSGTLNFGGSASGNFAPVTVSGGTLNFDNSAAVTLPSLTLSGGTVGGSGNVTVSGAFDVTGTYANLSGSGTLTTQGNSTVDLANVNGGYLGIGRNWVNEGTLSFGGNDFAYLGYPNGGTVTLTNAAGATLNLNTSAATPLAYYTGSSTIVNQGTLNHNAAGRHAITAPFSNGGTVNLNTGALVLSGNGSDAGRYALAEGSALEVAGGTRSLASGASVSGTGGLTVSGGTLNVDGDLDFSATAMTVSGGTLNFNGSNTVTLPNLRLSSGMLGGSGHVTVRGAFDVTGSYANLSGSGTLTTQGSSTVDMADVNGGYLGIGRNWVNEGTLTFGGNDFAYLGYPTGGAVTLTNTAGATLNLNTSATTPLAYYTGSSTIVNQGTLNHNATGRHTVSAPFSNSGTVNLNGGTLVLTANGSDTGRYALAEGSTLEVAGGTRSLARGASVSGTGGLTVTSGTLNVDGELDFSATAMVVDGGTLNFNGSTTVTLPRLSLGSGTLGGSGRVTVRGDFDVTGSYANLTGSGSITTQGRSTVDLAKVAGGYLGLSRNWVNEGTLSFSGDDLVYFGYPGGSATLTNAPGATLNLNSSAAQPLIHYTGSQTIVNQGTLNHGAAGRHMVSVALNNSGTVNVNAGTLVLAGNGSDAGRYALAEGSTLEIGGGVRSLLSGSSLSGGGTLLVSAGTLNIDSALDFSSRPVRVDGGTLNFNAGTATTLSSLELNGGSVGGSGDVIVTGAFDVTGSYASLTGSGSFTTQGRSVVDLADVNQGYLNLSRRWLNAGSLTLGGDDLIYLGVSGTASALSNLASGLVTLSSSHPSPLVHYAGSSSIENAGTLVLAAAGTHSLSSGTLDNSGSLLVRQGTWNLGTRLTQRGHLDIAGETRVVVSGNLSNQAGGTLSGSGTLQLLSGGTLRNLGSIAPGGALEAGTLTIEGHLSLAGGSLDIDLGGAAAGASDRLAVSGNVGLGGALRASLLGDYQPAVNEHVPVITTGGTASGVFASTELSGFTTGYNLAANEALRLIYAGSGTKVFTNAANNLDWNTAANWNGSLPGSADTVLISSGHSVSHASGNSQVGALTVASNNALTVSGGSLTVSGSTQLDGSFTVSGSGAASLNGGLGGAGRVSLQDGGRLTLQGGASMAELNLGGGRLDGSGSLLVDGAFTRSAGSEMAPDFSQISLTQQQGSLRPGALSAGSVLLATRDSAGLLDITGPVTSAGKLTVQAAGAMQVQGANAGLGAAGELNVSALSLDLAGPLSGQRLVLQGVNGVRLRDAAVLSAAASSGDAIVLDAAGTGPFINQVGASALVTGGGRWLVYSADPRADTVGGLAASFRQYNAPYGASTPQGSGNGLLYSLAPSVSVDLQGTVAKVYDGSAAAPLAATNLAVSGLLDMDQLSLGTPASAVFASKDVGSGKLVQVSGLTATVTDRAAGYPVYGLQVNSTASAAIGSITPAVLAVGGLSAVDKVYDATRTAGLSGTASVSAVAGDSVALSGTPTGLFADKHVGEAKAVTLSGLGLAGADAGNYTLQLPALAASIQPRPLSVDGVVVAGKVYDGGTAASFSQTGGIRALAGDDVALAGSPVARFADRHAGSAKTVNLSGFALAGSDAGNYSLQAPASTTAEITPAPLLLGGLSAADKVYDASRSATLPGSATLTPLGPDVVSLNGSASGLFADKNVGEAKPVTLSGLSLGGADAGNYTLVLPTLAASILPATAQLQNLVAAAKVYDGSSSAQLSAGLGGILGGDAVTLALSGQFASPAAGAAREVNWSAQLRGPDALNYRLPAVSGTAQAAIAQAVLSYVASPATGTAGQALPALGGSVAGFVAGESLATATSGTLQWDTPATTASAPGSYALLGSGLQAANYRFEQAPGNATALVLQAPAPTATADPATTATTVSTVAVLAAVQAPIAMSTPSQGRVLDVTLALAQPQPEPEALRLATTADRAAGDQAALPASAVAAVNAQRTADELRAITQRLGSGLADEGEAMGYKELDLSRLPRDEIQSLLAARARYKLKVFGNGVHRVRQDPALADVRPCASVAELDSGACIITDQLKREIQAAQAKAAQLRAREERVRNVKSAALPAIERKLALVIGINKYADRRIPELTGAVPDARALRDLLQQRLGYEPTVVENANREAIIKAFNKLALEAEPNDSVIIYYAGHGVVVPVDGADTGFWVPADGDSDKPESWVSNTDIARMVAAIGARQVMLVSDSCYSGRLVGKDRVLTSSNEADELLKRRAVVVMSSGGDEPVADQGRNGHSVFAWHFMRALDGLQAWQVGGSLFGRIRQSVVKEFPQTPQYGASQGAGHEGNTDYLFERRELQALRP